MAVYPTSYIRTNGGTAARNRDEVALPFNALPQAMTMYVRFIELGAVAAGGNARIVELGAGGTGGRLALDNSGSGYRGRHANDQAGAVTTSAVGSASYGDIVEAVVQLAATGTVTLSVSINSGATASNGPTAALQLAPSFTNALAQLGNISATGSNIDATGIMDLLVHRGTKDLATMRKLAGV